jgi:hypothetical protein
MNSNQRLPLEQIFSRVSDVCQPRPLDDDCTVVGVNDLGEGAFL